MGELIWGDVAISDLESIHDYIARDSHQYAKHQVERIYHSTERLRRFPESGRRVPEFSHLPRLTFPSSFPIPLAPFPPKAKFAS